MRYVRNIWRVVVTEPFTWIFDCFFQPSKLGEELKRYRPLARILPCLRLGLLLFLVFYPFAVILKMVSSLFLLSSIPPMGPLLLTIALRLIVITIVGTAVSIMGDIVTGTVMGVAMGVMAGFTWPTIATIGLGVGFACIITHYRGGIIPLVSTIILLIDLLVGVGTLAQWSIGTIVFGTSGIIAIFFIIAAASIYITSGGEPIHTRRAGSQTFTWLIILFIIVLLGFRMIVNSSVWNLVAGVVFGSIGLLLSLYFLQIASKFKTSGGDRVKLKDASDELELVCMWLVIAIVVVVGTMIGISSLTITNASISRLFVITYLLIYYGFLLYPFYSLSMIRAYLASLRNPTHVFTYLRRSSLYWDELRPFPLPYLKQMLLLAVEQDVEKTLLELRFIATQRPGQRHAAQVPLIEIIIRDLEGRIALQEIAFAWQRIAELFRTEDTGWLVRGWEYSVFTRLSDASREATRAHSSLGWQARIDALKAMLIILEGLNAKIKDTPLNKRLNNIIQVWTKTAQHELERLKNEPEKAEYLTNPYTPGLTLRPQDASFVGRRDIILQLTRALDSIGRRPTLLLYGERRMGKSSMLRQLPNLLGASYLPIFYDLQKPGIVSSTSAFLSELAQEISRTMALRGLSIKRLEYSSLREASREGDARSYQAFDKWLDDVEKVLEKEKRTILLLLDEFELLEEAGQRRAIDIDLLLSWLRSTIQSRARIALLFCGVDTFEELGSNWVRRLVNVQALKVSFLLPEEARQLIIHPVPDFPGQEIFDEKVVNKIIHLTGGHPFLIQAVCSQMIDKLNAEMRRQAEPQDVTSVVTAVINSWEVYFLDLWYRSDQQQQRCLMLLLLLNDGSLQQLVARSDLDEGRVRNALQRLLQRDLLLFENGLYRISTPMLREWVGQTLYESEEWLQIIDTNQDLFQGVLRQTLLSKGVVSGSAFPGVPPSYIGRLFQQYLRDHPNADVEYQEHIQTLSLSTRIEIAAQRMYLQLEAIMSAAYDHGITQNFEYQIEELFRVISTSTGFDTVHRRVSKHFITLLLHAESAFENMRVSLPIPVLVCPQSNISDQNLDDIRLLLLSGKFGPEKKMAMLLLFCEAEKLLQARYLLTKTLRAKYALDVVVINQDDLLDLVLSKDTRRTLRHLFLSQISLTAVDPYIITGPTPVHFFFGRETQLREIADHVVTTSYAIIGGRRIGKTSVMSCLHRSRLPARGFRTLYQDCSTISSYEAFLTAPTRDWQPEAPNPALSTLGDLLDSPPLDKPFVLLLDEADKLVPEDRKNSWRIFYTLRALANAKNIQVIFSGERTLREALKDPSGPLFNFANEKLLGPLDFPAVEELVTRPMKQLEIEIEDESSVVRHIYELTSGHPNVVQRFCRRLIDRLNERGSRRITLEDVVVVTNDPGFQENDFLLTYWEAATPLEKIITLVISQNMDTYGLQEIHELVYERTPIRPRLKETKEALERLVDLRSLLKHSQEGYAFAVSAFPRVLVDTTTVADLLSVLVEEYGELEQKQ